MTISRTTILLAVIGLVVLAAIAYLIFGKPDVSAAVAATPGGQSEAESIFINLTAEIDPVKFDTSILTDVRFRNLIDIHAAITPELSGRKDPFAPLTGTVQAAH